MKKLFVTLSAVPLSIAKPYVKYFNRTRYANIFNKYGSGKNKNRIYIPSGSYPKVEKVNVPAIIEQELSSLGYEVENYTTGIAKQIAGKRSMRIGKLLKSDAAKKTFANDPARSANKVGAGGLIVVISQHPYDIAGMSFDRGWSSCMNLTMGSSKNYVRHDIEHGSLVSYLIKNDDKNINAPIARILLKPYTKNKETILVPDKTYGSASPEFTKVVHKFCEWANSGSTAGVYRIHKDLYVDGNDVTIHGDVNLKKIPSAVRYTVGDNSTSETLMVKFIEQGLALCLKDNTNLTPYASKMLVDWIISNGMKMAEKFITNSSIPEKEIFRLLELDHKLAIKYDGVVTIPALADIMLEVGYINIYLTEGDATEYIFNKIMTTSTGTLRYEAMKNIMHSSVFDREDFINRGKFISLAACRELAKLTAEEDGDLISLIFNQKLFASDVYETLYSEAIKVKRESVIAHNLMELEHISNKLVEHIVENLTVIDKDSNNFMLGIPVFNGLIRKNKVEDYHVDAFVGKRLTLQRAKIVLPYLTKESFDDDFSITDDAFAYLLKNVSEKIFVSLLKNYEYQGGRLEKFYPLISSSSDKFKSQVLAVTSSNWIKERLAEDFPKLLANKFH